MSEIKKDKKYKKKEKVEKIKVDDRLEKRVLTPEGIIKPFEELCVTTKTVVAVSNLQIDLQKFYKYVPIVDYTPIKKKRGRQRKIVIPPRIIEVPYGQVISVKMGRQVRGLAKTKKSKTFFLHCVTIILALNNNKFINVKVCSNGKFHVTGCKTDEHFSETLICIYNILKDIELYTGEKVYRFVNENGEELNKEEERLEVIFNTVMQNMDFDIGFKISREQLDKFINNETKFSSIFVGSIRTSVNIKVQNIFENSTLISKMIYNTTNKEITKCYVPYTKYLERLDEKERRKQDKKDKYHTFLIFSSGSVIMSSSGPDMNKVFKDLIETLINNRTKFEDKLSNKKLINDDNINPLEIKTSL